MENIKLLVLDIDGTLLPHKALTITDSLKEGIEKAKKNGVEILIATGRHYKFIPKQLLEDLEPDYVVTINGSCLTDVNGNIILSHSVPMDILNKMTEECIKRDIAVGYKFKDNLVVYHNYNKYVTHYIGFDSPFASLIIDGTKTKDYHKTHGAPLGIFLIEKKEVIAPLKDLFPTLTFAVAQEWGSDAYQSHINKATTIEEFLKIKNLSWDNVLSCGDALNDLQMLQKAKIGVLMGNYKDESLVNHADYITESVENDGVLKALEHFKII